MKEAKNPDVVAPQVTIYGAKEIKVAFEDKDIVNDHDL